MTLQQVLADYRRQYEAAPIVETLGEYRDTFERHWSIASVELCHGVWCTFTRMFGTGDPHWRQHADREAARTFAREWIAR